MIRELGIRAEIGRRRAIRQGLKWKRRATGLRGGAPPMGVSFHQVDRRFEGRESATTNLSQGLEPGG
jgi:hypothetical protein